MSKTYMTLAVTYNYQSCKTEAASTFNDLGTTVDVYHAVC
jgi:hypothetical protein